MSVNFDLAFQAVVGVEGGYVNDPKDPGGETNYGLSKRANPDLDIKNLTFIQAKQRYLTRYWNPYSLDELEFGKALLYFDAAVNGGNPKRWFEMYGGYPLTDFVIAFQAEHNLYLSSLKDWETYKRGWSRRLVKMALLAMRIK